MGGEPTFVSIDDFQSDEWNTAAVGPTKRALSDDLIRRLRDRFGPGGFLHYGQGKWYPGESLPRWAFALYWRKDGKPVWKNPALVSGMAPNAQAADPVSAGRFCFELAETLGVGKDYVIPAYEDTALWMLKEGQLPSQRRSRATRSSMTRRTRARMVRVFERGLGAPTGYILPIQRWNARATSAGFPNAGPCAAGGCFFRPAIRPSACACR